MGSDHSKEIKYYICLLLIKSNFYFRLAQTIKNKASPFLLCMYVCLSLPTLEITAFDIESLNLNRNLYNVLMSQGSLNPKIRFQGKKCA